MIDTAAMLDWSGDRAWPPKATRLGRTGPVAVVRSDLSAPESKIDFADNAALAGDATTIAVLVTLLEDQDDEVVAAAADALGHIGHWAGADDVCLRLAQMLIDEQKPGWLRDTCAYALGEIGCPRPEVISVLTEVAGRANGSIGRCASEALEKLLRG